MDNFEDILNEPLPSHTPLFVECVENDYGSIRVYYEEASDLYTLYIEKSHQTPEEKKKQQELLKKLKYDPKTKTIEVDGHKTQFKIDRENHNSAYSKHVRLNKKEQKKLNNAIDAANSTKKELDIKRDKDLTRLRNKEKTIYATIKDGVTKGNYTGLKSNGITIGKKNLNEEVILHEVGHIRDASNRRKAAAEPSYVAKYGTKELSKDVRKARLELNKLKKKLEPTSAEKRRIEKLEKIVQKGIESTPSYKEDKGQQRRDAIEKMDKELQKKLKKRKLNSHDKTIGEYYADAYAIKHGSSHGKDMYKGIDSILDRQIKETKTKTYIDNAKKDLRKTIKRDKNVDIDSDSKILTVTAKGMAAVDRHLIRKTKKSAKERRKIARKINKKYGKTAVESAI